MEVHFTPDIQAKLDQLSRETGRPREMLDRRYDDLESGRVQPIDGEEAYRRLMARTEARRQHQPA